MPVGEAFLDAFINANILIVVAYLMWQATRALMRPLGLSHDHGTQLRLLNAAFLVIVATPLLTLGHEVLLASGLVRGLNLSDMVVAWYLNGGVEMRAADFETLVHARDTLMIDVLSASGLLAQALIALFLTGLAVGLLRLSVSVASLWRITRGAYGWRRFGRVRILLSDRILVPFSTRGLTRYYVVIPSHMLAQSHELKVSIAHELQHIRQGDLEWEVLLEALKPLFFLNPAFHAWKRQVEALREFRCDAAVLSRGRIGARDYCDTLLSVCQTTLRRDRSFVIAVPKVTLVTVDRLGAREGALGTLERRILSLTGARRLGRHRLAFLAIAAPLMGAVMLTSLAIQRPGDWSHDRLMLSTVVNLERMDEINRLSTFGRLRD